MKYLSIALLVAVLLLGAFYSAKAATVLFPIGGGTGTSTPSGILYGSNSNSIPLKTVTIGSGLTFTGGTLSSTGGTSDEKWATSSDLTSIYPNSATKVGIGSTSPFAKLSVKGAGTTSGINFQTTNSSDSPLFTVLDNGNVGIGTTSPQRPLQVTGTTPLRLERSNIGWYDFTLSGGSVSSDTLDLVFQNGQNGGYLFTTNSGNTNALAINNAGNVGIGTTTPGTLLSVGNTGGINFNPTATSTFSSSANGINITNGCYAINGVCIGGGGSGTVTAVTGTWPIISSGGTTPNLTWGGIATSSPIAAASGLLYATGVNTFASVSTSSPIAMSISGNAGTVTNGVYTTGAGTVYEVPLTFSTGLTRTTNTVTVNTSQNISTLSNLTGNGFVKTSGGTGALSIDTSTYLTAITGGTCTNQFVRAVSTAGAVTCATVVNADLANSSITVSNGGGLTVSGSPVSLGGTLTVSLNTANSNTWTGLQQFNANASTTGLTNSGQTWLTALGTPAGAFLAVDANGKIIATTTPAGGVTSVSNSDGTLTISPTTGAVTASLALGHANTWTGAQTLGSNLLIATSPKLTTSIADTNGNTIIGLSPAGSATNYVTIANSAGGTPNIGTNSGIVNLNLTGGGGVLTLTGDGTGTNGITLNMSGGSTPVISPTQTNTSLQIDSNGSGVILLNKTAGNVGVGTTTPGSLLSIGGNTTGTNFYNNATTSKKGVGGYDISDGCFSKNGTCIGAGSITVSNGGGLTVSGSPVSLGGTVTLTLNTSNANTWSALQQFNGNASTTQFSVYNNAYFGATATSTFNSLGQLSIGTSTSPWSSLTLDRGFNGIASSSITVTQYAPSATSTSMTADCRDSNTIHLAIGTSATTITLAPMVGGQTCKVIVSNPNGTAGAITWATTASQQLYWANGTPPTQTTTANKRDVWSFVGDKMPASASSTQATSILGAQTANF